jgi:phosphatidylglycerophosphatase A
MSPARIVATLGGIGLARPAPGTWASAVILPLAWLGPQGCLILAAIAFAGGVWAIGRLEREGLAAEDPSWVVIDEAAGMLLALAAIPPGAPWLWVVTAFALFRFFDIMKRGPVGWLDKRKGAVWVMLDDVMAGALAALVIFTLRALL